MFSTTAVSLSIKTVRWMCGIASEPDDDVTPRCRRRIVIYDNHLTPSAFTCEPSAKVRVDPVHNSGIDKVVVAICADSDVLLSLRLNPGELVRPLF